MLICHISQQIYRFKARHPTIQSIFGRQLEHARYKQAIYERVERWFNTVK